MCGRGHAWWGHAWQGARAWQGGHAWQILHTVNERAVRILLECILVLELFHRELYSARSDNFV